MKRTRSLLLLVGWGLVMFLAVYVPLTLHGGA